MPEPATHVRVQSGVTSGDGTVKTIEDSTGSAYIELDFRGFRDNCQAVVYLTRATAKNLIEQLLHETTH